MCQKQGQRQDSIQILQDRYEGSAVLGCTFTDTKLLQQQAQILLLCVYFKAFCKHCKVCYKQATTCLRSCILQTLLHMLPMQAAMLQWGLQTIPLGQVGRQLAA